MLQLPYSGIYPLPCFSDYDNDAFEEIECICFHVSKLYPTSGIDMRQVGNLGQVVLKRAHSWENMQVIEKKMLSINACIYC